ncbi:hypothetical protein K431DRAFT_349262 [Polychaeton citri CBS 116435]|uniref:Uncharacterized protein n=1 Tax=Polychaeton citri CBS 116435 TaxID=1314669 RepID=A0A9P4UMB3_9PEZI|nr:hypothetical protein K431DRAFT_349262 [Polychaeton citri CBS 116435]
MLQTAEALGPHAQEACLYCEHTLRNLKDISQTARRVVDVLWKIHRSPKRFQFESQYRLDVLKEVYRFAKGLRHGLRQFLDERTDVKNLVQGRSLPRELPKARSHADGQRPSLCKDLSRLLVTAMPRFGKTNNVHAAQDALLKAITDTVEWELRSIKKEIRHLEMIIEREHCTKERSRGLHGHKTRSKISRQATGSHKRDNGIYNDDHRTDSPSVQRHRLGSQGSGTATHTERPKVPYQKQGSTPQYDALLASRSSFDTVHPDDSVSNVSRSRPTSLGRASKRHSKRDIETLLPQ